MGIVSPAKDRVIYAVLCIYVFLLYLILSRTSPLFMFNPGHDSNIYFVMGRGIFNGFVPYVDLVDHKGPIIFFLHGLGSLIDNTGFFGIYLLYSGILSVFAVYVYKIARLFIESSVLSFLAALVSPFTVLILVTAAVAEEPILAAITVSFYYFLRFFIEPEKYKLRYVVLQGLLFGVVFLIKFNIMVFFGGFILAVFLHMHSKKQYQLLGKYIICFAAGALIVFAPYLVYALATGSLDAFIEFYFVFNSMYSQARTGAEDIHFVPRLALGFAEGLRNYLGRPHFAVAVLMGLAFTFMKCRPIFIGYAVSFVLLLTFIHISPTWDNTIVPLSVFCLMGIVMFFYLAEKILPGSNIKRFGFAAGCVFIILSAMLAGWFSMVQRPEFLRREVPVQLMMADILWENARDDSPTLLQTGETPFFFTATGIIPEEPFFFDMSVSHSDFPIMRDSRNNAIREARSEFVITRAGSEEAAPNPELLLHENYTRIASLQDGDSWWQLWQRIDS